MLWWVAIARRLTSRSTASTTSSLNDSPPSLSCFACFSRVTGNRIVTASRSIFTCRIHIVIFNTVTIFWLVQVVGLWKKFHGCGSGRSLRRVIFAASFANATEQIPKPEETHSEFSSAPSKTKNFLLLPKNYLLWANVASPKILGVNLQGSILIPQI